MRGQWLQQRWLPGKALLVALLATSLGCEVDNGVQKEMTKSDLLHTFAKVLTYNPDYSTRVRGVFQLDLKANQALDQEVWNWENPGYFSDSTRVISSIQTLSDPLPTTSAEFSQYLIYLDGTAPYTQAETGVLRPIKLDSKTEYVYDTNGDEVVPTTYDTFVVTYNAQTGDLESYVETYYATDGSLSSMKSYGFTEDPRPDSQYYLSSYILREGTDASITGSYVSSVTYSASDTLIEEVVTEATYDTDGALAEFSDYSFGTANDETVVKQVTTTTTYLETTADVNAFTQETIIKKYDSSDTEVWEQVETTLYANKYLGEKVSYSIQEYNVSSSGNKTLSDQTTQVYSYGLLATQNEYLVSSGNASLNRVITYSRDTAGRVLQVLTQNGSYKNLALVRQVRDETSGLTTKLRTFDYNSNSKKVCDTGNYNYEYEYLSTNSGEFRKVSAISYACDGTAVSTTPSSKTVTVYNLLGLVVSYQEYSYTSGTYVLTAQSAYEYNTKGNKTKEQTYTVSNGSATADSYTVYTYDNYDFLISSIEYDVDDAITGSYSIISYNYH